MLVRKNFNMDENIVKRAEVLAAEDNTSMTKIVEDALLMYLDSRYMEDKATVIPSEILKAFGAKTDLLEKRLNSKTNKVLSELAIQVGILEMVIANNLEVDPGQLERYRIAAVEFLKNNNRPLRLDEVFEDV